MDSLLPATLYKMSANHVLYMSNLFSGDSRGAVVLSRIGCVVALHLETVNQANEELQRGRYDLEEVANSVNNIIQGYSQGFLGLRLNSPVIKAPHEPHHDAAQGSTTMSSSPPKLLWHAPTHEVTPLLETTLLDALRWIMVGGTPLQFDAPFHLSLASLPLRMGGLGITTPSGVGQFSHIALPYSDISMGVQMNAKVTCLGPSASGITQFRWVIFCYPHARVRNVLISPSPPRSPNPRPAPLQVAFLVT
eukprot:gene30733-37133_t